MNATVNLSGPVLSIEDDNLPRLRVKARDGDPSTSYPCRKRRHQEALTLAGSTDQQRDMTTRNQIFDDPRNLGRFDVS
jgi:hypothetical protein